MPQGSQGGAHRRPNSGKRHHAWSLACRVWKVAAFKRQPLLIYKEDMPLLLSTVVTAVSVALGKSSVEAEKAAQVTLRVLTQAVSTLKEKRSGARKPAPTPTGADSHVPIPPEPKPQRQTKRGRRRPTAVKDKVNSGSPPPRRTSTTPLARWSRETLTITKGIAQLEKKTPWIHQTPTHLTAILRVCPDIMGDT